MDLQKTKRANELMGLIEKKENLIKRVEEQNVSYGLDAEIYKNTLERAKKVVIDRLQNEKKKLEDEFASL